MSCILFRKRFYLLCQPYYDQRGESNPEFAYKDADPDEQLFEDRAAEETPVKTKESRKKGKTIS